MRKRWIIGGVVVALAFASAYTGYWFWLADTFEGNLALWINQQRAMGYRISYSASEPSGYPLPVTIRLTNLAVEGPVGYPPLRFDTASMRLGVAPWSPLTLQVDSEGAKAGYRLQWAAGTRDYDLSIEGLSLAIRLPTQGDRLAIEIKKRSVSVSEGDHDIAWINHLAGSVEFFEAPSHTESSVTFDLAADGINFPMPPPTHTVETYFWGLSGQVMGQLPPEPLPRALAAWSSAGGYLKLTEARASWELRTEMNVEGSFALDADLQPIGAMTADLRGYPAMIDWLVSIGKMTPAQGTATKLALGAKARRTTDPVFQWESRVPLMIQDGYLSVGAMKVVRMPRIEWQ